MILYRLTRKLIRDPKQFFLDFINNRKHLRVDPKDTVFAFNIKEWKRPYLERFYSNKKIVYIPINLNESLLRKKYIPLILNNNIEILANNLNIQPGGSVPFMLVFVNPPSNISTLFLKIIDAKDSPAN